MNEERPDVCHPCCRFTVGTRQAVAGYDRIAISRFRWKWQDESNESSGEASRVKRKARHHRIQRRWSVRNIAGVGSKRGGLPTQQEGTNERGDTQFKERVAFFTTVSRLRSGYHAQRNS